MSYIIAEKKKATLWGLEKKHIHSQRGPELQSQYPQQADHNICNSNLRDSATLFWPLEHTGARGHAHIHPQKIK